MRDRAEALALMLQFGIGQIDGEVVAQLNRWLVEVGSPLDGEALGAFSMESSIEDVIHVLNGFPGACDKAVVARLVVDRLACAVADGAVQPSRAAKLLYELFLKGFVPRPELEQEMVALDDAFVLAESGVYGSIDEATERLGDFFQEFLDGEDRTRRSDSA